VTEARVDIDVSDATIAEKPVLGRLLELYLYDFSEVAGFDVDSRGRYGYRRLDSYWTEDNRFPFLIMVDGKLAGFALVWVADQDDEPEIHMAEFFVMRKYRRQGIGQTVAAMLFDRFPGQWHVSQLHENVPAQRFWRSVIAGYTGGDFSESVTDRRVVQTFRSGRNGQPT
jgi:predicted acetyltransferase